MSAAASAPPPASAAPPLKPAIAPIPSVSTGSSSSLSIHSSSSIMSPPAAQPSVASPPQIATKKGSSKGSRLMVVPLEKPLVTQLSPRPDLSRSASSGEHLALRRSAPELIGCVVPPNAPPAIIEHASRLPRRNPSPAQKVAARAVAHTDVTTEDALWHLQFWSSTATSAGRAVACQYLAHSSLVVAYAACTTVFVLSHISPSHSARLAAEAGRHG